MLNTALNVFANYDRRSYCRMSKKHYYVIEVKVPNGPEGCQKLANSKLTQAIERLKTAVEELGGKVCVRY